MLEDEDAVVAVGSRDRRLPSRLPAAVVRTKVSTPQKLLPPSVDEAADLRRGPARRTEHPHAARVVRAVGEVLLRVGGELVDREVAEAERVVRVERLGDRVRVDLAASCRSRCGTGARSPSRRRPTSPSTSAPTLTAPIAGASAGRTAGRTAAWSPNISWNAACVVQSVTIGWPAGYPPEPQNGSSVVGAAEVAVDQQRPRPSRPSSAFAAFSPGKHARRSGRVAVWSPRIAAAALQHEDRSSPGRSPSSASV